MQEAGCCATQHTDCKRTCWTCGGHTHLCSGGITERGDVTCDCESDYDDSLTDEFLNLGLLGQGSSETAWLVDKLWALTLDDGSTLHEARLSRVTVVSGTRATQRSTTEA